MSGRASARGRRARPTRRRVPPSPTVRRGSPPRAPPTRANHPRQTRKSPILKDLAVAISVYDKFEEVKILVDIFRENFGGQFDIIVCSSHADPASHLEHCDIDDLLKTDNIPLDRQTMSAEQFHSFFFMRVIDSIRKSCGRAACSDAPYTLHTHADGFPLSWPRIQSLISAMKRNQQYFAARGYGFGFYSHDAPFGAFDDMFFFFNNRHARDQDLWGFDLIDYLPHKISVHGLLAMLGLSKVGLRHFFHYATWSNATHWDGQSVFLSPFNSAHPMYIDILYDFVHIHDHGFPNGLGPRLRAYFLTKHGLTKGPAIRRFLEKWDTSGGDALFLELRQLEDSLNGFFSTRGLSSKKYGRDFGTMTRIVRDYRNLRRSQRVRWILGQHVAQYKNAIRPHYNKHIRYRPYRRIHGDTIWPASLDEFYTNELHIDSLGVDEFQGVSLDATKTGER
jgi:hypothetical protein